MHKNLRINVVNLSIVHHIKLLYTTCTTKKAKMSITSELLGPRFDLQVRQGIRREKSYEENHDSRNGDDIGSEPDCMWRK